MPTNYKNVPSESSLDIGLFVSHSSLEISPFSYASFAIPSLSSSGE